MSNEKLSMVARAMAALRALVDRAFERLERAQLGDVERSIAGASNERELSQRVHRLETGEAPLDT